MAHGRSSFVALCAIVLIDVAPAMALRGYDEAVFRSVPSGAQVYLDDQLIGTTPLSLSVACDQVVDRRYRIQYQDCEPAEGILSARVAPGRVVGMVFSLGVSAIFQCPNYFVPVNVLLTGGVCGSGGVPVAAQGPSGDLAERLRVLRDLHQRGVLTDAEYEQERERALNGL